MEKPLSWLFRPAMGEASAHEKSPMMLVQSQDLTLVQVQDWSFALEKTTDPDLDLVWKRLKAG